MATQVVSVRLEDEQCAALGPTPAVSAREIITAALAGEYVSASDHQSEVARWRAETMQLRARINALQLQVVDLAAEQQAAFATGAARERERQAALAGWAGTARERREFAAEVAALAAEHRGRLDWPQVAHMAMEGGAVAEVQAALLRSRYWDRFVLACRAAERVVQECEPTQGAPPK